MNAGSVAGLARALDATGALVAGVRDEQWADPTPCSEWKVCDLTGHLIAGNRLFAGVLRRLPDAPAGTPAGGSASDLPRAYREAADDLLAAFSLPGVLEETFTVPFGTVPGSVALHLRITELLVHGWDLATATGQPARFPEDLAGEELAFTRRTLASIPAGRNPFGPPQPAPAGAAPLDQLAALLGRTVTAGGSGTGE